MSTNPFPASGLQERRTRGLSNALHIAVEKLADLGALPDELKPWRAARAAHLGAEADWLNAEANMRHASRVRAVQLGDEEALRCSGLRAAVAAKWQAETDETVKLADGLKSYEQWLRMNTDRLTDEYADACQPDVSLDWRTWVRAKWDAESQSVG